jgi:uncharacterized membrane protein YeaQ/YmgE (transglycosylase-associated protein family)
MNVIYYLIIGALAGWIAGKIMKGRGFGVLGNLIVGIVGGLVGGLVFDLLQLQPEGVIGSLITAIVGAVVFLYLVSLIRSK